MNARERQFSALFTQREREMEEEFLRLRAVILERREKLQTFDGRSAVPERERTTVNLSFDAKRVGILE